MFISNQEVEPVNKGGLISRKRGAVLKVDGLLKLDVSPFFLFFGNDLAIIIFLMFLNYHSLKIPSKVV